MTHNKPSKEEGLFPLPFLFFCFMQGRPQYAYATTNKGRNTAEIAQKQRAEGGKL